MKIICIFVFKIYFVQDYTRQRASPVTQMVKSLPAVQETRCDPWVRKIP